MNSRYQERLVHATSTAWMLVLLTTFLAGCGTSASRSESRETTIKAGSGTPTVVFQAGFGNGKETWDTVLPTISHEFTVFAYDRPGMGANPPPTTPRDPCTIAQELRSQLETSGLAPPYLLVGHSLGGLYQYVYAKLYPTEVAGLVLIDPTHPGNWQAVESADPMAATLIKAMRLTSFSATEKAEFDSQTSCIDRLDLAKPLQQPSRILISGRPQALGSIDYENRRLALATEWPAMLGVKAIDMVRDASHFIQKEAPEYVIAAVRDVADHNSDRTKPLAVPVQEAATIELGTKPAFQMVPGKTRSDSVSKALGKPLEQFSTPDGIVMIYNDKLLDVHWTMNLIPLIGDAIDLIQTIDEWNGQRELVLQFDASGTLRRYKLRHMN